MVDIIQTFFSYIGLTFFVCGLIFCFLANTFRFGVFCTVIGNIFFCSAIIFPKQIIFFINEYNLNELFTLVNTEMLKEKAIITGLIFIALSWALRWIKHLIVDGLLIFIFPTYFQPTIKNKKMDKNPK